METFISSLGNEFRNCCVVSNTGEYRKFVLVGMRENRETGEKSEYIKNYNLKADEILVDASVPTMRAFSGAPGFVKPKWDANASAWIESATNEEITAWEDEHPDPNAKTLEELKTDKKAKLSAACNETIVDGIDIQLPGGTTEHFDYSERDQINIKEMFDAVLMGATMYPYQSEDGNCRTYTAAEIVTIYPALAGNKTAQLTYYHQLKDYIETLDTEEKVDAVTYGQPLTGEYLEHYNEMVAVAAEQMQTVVSRVTSAMST